MSSEPCGILPFSKVFSEVKKVQKRGFDVTSIVDINYPLQQYNKWGHERRSRLFSRIIAIHPHHLNAAICRKAVVLAGLLGKKLPKKFMIRTENFEKEKEESNRQLQEEIEKRIMEEIQMPSTSGTKIEPELYIEPLDEDEYLEIELCPNDDSSQKRKRRKPKKRTKKMSSPEVVAMDQQINSTQLEEEEEEEESEIIRVPSPVAINPWGFQTVSQPEPVCTSLSIASPLEELAKTEAYTLEEPLITVTKRSKAVASIQEIKTAMDMVLLCQLRDDPSVVEPFIHYTTPHFLRRISAKLGNDFEIREEVTAAHAGCDRITRKSVWFQGMAKILTVGEGFDSDRQIAHSLAYASCMASLVYMMVIPYQLILMVQAGGKKFIPLAIHACRHRIEELITASRDPYYGQLHLHTKELSSCNEEIKEVWRNFINKMRHMGMIYWENNNKVKVPEFYRLFPKNIIPGFYFEYETDREELAWNGSTRAEAYDIAPFDNEDFRATFPVSRFSYLPAEAGIIKSEHTCSDISQGMQYKLKHRNPNLPRSKFDQIVHLPFRDLLFQFGANVLSPKPTLFAVKHIGHRWGRRLLIKHQIVINVNAEYDESLKHVVRLSFDGIPYFFLGATCSKANFTSALTNCCSIIAQQLSAMMIIPQELCKLLESKSCDIIDAVIYGCRFRFQAFEVLMRNPMFASLYAQDKAEINFKNQLYKLTEKFYWRMRNTGWEYWVENRLFRVPMELINIKKLPHSTFFQFLECFETVDWNQLNSPDDTFDNFDVNCLVAEDRFPAHWENTEEEDYDQPAVNPECKNTGARDLETELLSEYRIPLCLLTAKECDVVLDIVRSLAGMGMTVLQMKVTSESLPAKRTRYNCEMKWAGHLGWILNAQYSDERESNLQYGAAWILYKLLIKMGIVPPGLYKFVSNNQDRLPYVISSLAPFFIFLESILPTYRRMGDKPSSRNYLIAEMYRLTVKEWLTKSIPLPPILFPTLFETDQFSFIKAATMGFKEYEEWNRQSSRYQQKADILDIEDRPTTKRPQIDLEGNKLNKRKCEHPSNEEEKR